MKKFILPILAVLIISPNILYAQYTNALKITINGYGFSDETVVRFVEGATFGFDGDFDAWKLMSPNPMAPSIYSKTNSDENLSINSLPIPNNEMSIEIHTNVAYSGLYTVTIEDVFAFDNDLVMSFIDVENAETYTYTSGNTTTFDCVLQPNTTTATFRLNISKTMSTSIKNESVKNDFKVLTKANGVFDLIFNDSSEKSIMVYDITGKTVLKERINSSNLHLNLENKQTGLYIITIDNGIEIISKKLFR